MMIPFTETAYITEYKKLCVIIGKSKMNADSWDEWARIQSIFGWPLLIKAAEQCEPLKRWPPNVESICLQLKREYAYADKPAEKFTPMSDAERKRFHALVQEVKSYQPSKALFHTPNQLATNDELPSVACEYNNDHEEKTQ